MAIVSKIGLDGARIVVTNHFMDQARKRVHGDYLDIPEKKLYEKSRQFPNQKCRTLLEGVYWVIFKYEEARHQVVLLTLMPRRFVLPEPSILVRL